MTRFALVVTTDPVAPASLDDVHQQHPQTQNLDANIARLIPLEASTVAEARALCERLADHFSGNTVDVNVIDHDAPAMRLLIADMESTIIEQEMLDELADYVDARDEVSDITARAMRGELDFEAAITARVALLEGLDASALVEVAASRLTYMPGARTLVATMKRAGAYCALVSGGFTHFTGKVAAELGFDEHHANTLEIQDGKLTGRVVPPILGRDAKQRNLETITARLGIEPKHAIAVGDGANDLAMLRAAGIGVAYRAKPNLRDEMAAAGNGAVITHCDLTALLYLQGYASTQFVTP